MILSNFDRFIGIDWSGAKDCYFLLALAMEAAGAPEGPRVARALAETKNFPGVSGTLTMGPDHNPIKGVVVIKVEQGKFAYQTTINP
jgi:branched-chain amino acid transport system substrate-binding protein